MSNARELSELAGSYGTGGFVGMKNRIINGAMMIDQRNAGASLSLATTGTGLYAVDRFSAYVDKSGITGTVFQSQQTPAGFTSSFGMSITTGATSGASDQSFIQHMIEGLNVPDLAWGSASAQPVTLSFWVRSSITGTNGFSVSNSAGDRVYIGSYTVNSANTWEQKSVTVPGDTSGTWLTTNGIGIRLRFNTGSGSGRLSTPGSWGTTYYAGPTGSFSTTGTSGATFYITGVQLEKGSTATSFDYRPYGTELALCQRYFYKTYNMSQALGTAFAIGNGGIMSSSPSYAYASAFCKYAVNMRAVPTVTTYSHTGASGAISYDTGGSLTSSTSISVNAGTETGTLAGMGNVSSFGIQYQLAASSEL